MKQQQPLLKFSDYIKLNIELLETLCVTSEYLKDYAEKNKIPLPNNSTFYSLISKAEALTEELSNNQLLDEKKYFLGNRRFLTDSFKKNKTDEDLTEPGFLL